MARDVLFCPSGLISVTRQAESWREPVPATGVNRRAARQDASKPRIMRAIPPVT